MTGALRIQVWKEFRALLPWWAGVIFPVAVFGYLSQFRSFGHDLFNPAVLIHMAGSAALGSLSVGHEFSHRTMGGLLTYPVDRRRVIAIKLALLAAFLVVAVAVARLSLGATLEEYGYRVVQQRQLIYAPAISSLFLAPWLTMVFRGPLAGAVLSIAIPILLLTIGRPFDLRSETLWLIFLGLAAVGAVMTWVTFVRLSVVDGPQQTTGTTGLFERPMPIERVGSADAARASWVWLSFLKELRLQQMTFVVSGLYVMVWTLTVLARSYDPANHAINAPHYAITGLYGTLVALLAGSLVSAEERHFGVAEWQLLLPVASWKQWAFKVCVATTIALALAIGLPLVLQTIHASPDDIPFDPELIVAVVLLTSAGLYASSPSASGLRALLATFPLLAGVAIVGGLISPASRLAYDAAVRLATEMMPPGSIGPHTATRVMSWFGAAAIVAGWGVLLSFAFANHRTADRSRERILRQVLWMVVVAVILTVTAGVVRGILWAGLERPGY